MILPSLSGGVKPSYVRQHIKIVRQMFSFSFSTEILRRRVGDRNCGTSDAHFSLTKMNIRDSTIKRG